VVLGHESDRVQAELSGLPYTAVLNSDYARGMNTSLRAGIAALPDDAAGAVVLLGRHAAGRGNRWCARLVTAHRRSGPEARDLHLRRGSGAPPSSTDAPCSGAARARSESCGKSVVRNHRAGAVELQWPPETLTDLDSPEDVDRIRARLEAA